LLTRAYSVLSSPERRAEYDATRKNGADSPTPLSSTIDFMDSVKGELNRRLAMLAILYFQRRSNPYSPELCGNPARQYSNSQQIAVCAFSAFRPS
jgi:curved DNA-binding protein CbpA